MNGTPIDYLRDHMTEQEFADFLARFSGTRLTIPKAHRVTEAREREERNVAMKARYIALIIEGTPSQAAIEILAAEFNLSVSGVRNLIHATAIRRELLQPASDNS